MTTFTKIIPLMALAISALANAKDVPAGPIWDHEDAKAKCPRVCSDDTLLWNGHWHTTIFGEMSVCSCESQDFAGDPAWLQQSAQQG